MQQMTAFKIIALALGLAADAFIASAALGAANHRDRFGHAFKLALYVSFFHGIMPVLGWITGRSFFLLIQPYDHWLAFVLLTLVGIKLYREDVEENNSSEMFKIQSLIFLSLALSLDALVIGMTLSFLNYEISTPAFAMGF